MDKYDFQASRFNTKLFFLFLFSISLIFSYLHDKSNFVMLSDLTPKNKHYTKTKVIFIFSENNITVDDQNNYVTKIYFNDNNSTKKSISISIENGIRSVFINRNSVNIGTEKRVFKVLNYNQVDGIGSQFLGIQKMNKYHFYVDENKYFFLKHD